MALVNKSIKQLPQAMSGWNTEAIYSDAEEYYSALIADIACATVSIELAVYIFSLDTVGHSVLKSLEAAAQRGVSIRVIIDGIGSVKDAKKIALRLSKVDADIRIFHPLPWALSIYRWSLTSGGVFKKIWRFLSLVNRRDHRKLCVIDQSIAWCGSFNICDEDILSRFSRREYGVRLTGYPVSGLVESFNSVWLQRKANLNQAVLRFISSNSSRVLRRMKNELLVESIASASKRLWMCNAYFAPSNKIVHAIKAATLRGVDVRLILASRSDVKFFPWLSQTYYADLLAMGVKIYSYQPGILHAKVVVFDDRCFIGSTNFNHRSYYHDLELDVVLTAEPSIRKMSSLLKQDMNNSILVNYQRDNRWLHSIVIGWFLRLLRYWM